MSISRVETHGNIGQGTPGAVDSLGFTICRFCILTFGIGILDVDVAADGALSAQVFYSLEGDGSSGLHFSAQFHRARSAKQDSQPVSFSARVLYRRVHLPGDGYEA